MLRLRRRHLDLAAEYRSCERNLDVALAVQLLHTLPGILTAKAAETALRA